MKDTVSVQFPDGVREVPCFYEQEFLGNAVPEPMKGWRFVTDDEGAWVAEERSKELDFRFPSARGM